MNTKITPPHISYFDSFIRNSQNDKTSLRPYDYSYIKKNPQRFLEDFKKHAKGLSLPLEWVPYEHYWIISNEEYSGWIDLRPKINDSLKFYGGHISYEILPLFRRKGLATFALKEILQKARARGLNEVLITSDKSNEASKKVIESNGGIFIDEIQIPEINDKTLRYKIKLL